MSRMSTAPHCKSRISRLLAALGCLLLTCVSQAREEVSRKAPEGYDRHVAPLLTPLASVRAGEDPYVGSDEPGSVRLNELVTRVNEDGTYLRAIHYVYAPYSQQGVEGVSTDRFTYSAHQEKVHLVLARTILPDGTIKELGPNAAFIQKGRRSTSSIYDDSQDLVIVYPDVKPGVLCEVVVVYERTQPPVADEYSQVVVWGSGWPIVNKRMVVDVPASWSKRLQVKSLGVPVKPVKLKSPQDRLVQEWAKQRIDGGQREPSRAPAMQTGPATWLTTLADWDEVAAWYQGLINQRNQLGEPLSKLVDEWTRDAGTPREVLAILHDKVANEIRYEGLEFGMSGLQPYACSTVWQNQYGDCKDKSNLLVAMLGHKGIRARVVLVNTEHAGLVDRRIPDFRHFNHAITAVDLGEREGKTEWIFCDPTIEHGRPGLLSPGSAGRDVLVIDDSKALWLKTPESTAGSRFFDFELKLETDGRLSGWLKIESQGLYAIQDVASFSGLDRQTARARLGDLAEGYIAGASVVDFVLPDKKPVDGKVSYKVYFTAPARQPDEDGRLGLAYPASLGLFYDYGDQEKRTTSYFQWPDSIRIDARIKLPEGWRPESLPSPIDIGGEAYKVSAQWKFEDGACRASLRADCLQAVIPAAKVAVYAQANRALFAWLEVPLMVKRGAEAPLVQARGDLDLPLMPTGQGQLNLVDELYPRGGDAAKRQQALEKVIQFFPNDPEAVFDARVWIGMILHDAGQYDDAAKHFERLLARDPGAVGLESIGWARYLQAISLKEAGKQKEAIARMRAIADNDRYDVYRRGWAALVASGWMQEGDDGEAAVIESLLEQALLSGGECADDALPSLIKHRIEAGQGEKLVELITQRAQEESGWQGLTELLAGMAHEISDEGLAMLVAQVGMVAKSDQVGVDARAALEHSAQQLDEVLGERAKYAEVRRRMSGAFRQFAPEHMEKDAGGKEVGEVIEALERAEGVAHAEWLDLAAVYFRDFDSTEKMGWICWRTLDHARLLHGGDKERVKFVMAVADVCSLLPKTDENHWECRFVLASLHESLRQWKQAEDVYRAMIEDELFDDGFSHSAWHRMGNVLELQGRFKEAVTAYSRFADERESFRSITECLLRAGLLQARLGEYPAALETWRLLADVPEKFYQESVMAQAIREAILLAQSPEETLAQWQRTDAWWNNHFLKHLEQLGAADAEAIRIFLPDGGEGVDERCGEAIRREDFMSVAADLQGVAMSARWLPSQMAALWTMYSSYVLKMRPKSTRDNMRVIMELGAATRIGLVSSLEFSSRIHGYGAMSLDDMDEALKVLSREAAGIEGRSDEHLERSTYLYMTAALEAGRQLDGAIRQSGRRLGEGLDYVEAGDWVSLHADLLIKDGRTADAVAFMEDELQKPVLERDEDARQVREKLQVLSRSTRQSNAMTAAATRLLKDHKPSWYDHVGPRGLDDPRIGDPATLDVDKLVHLHELEAFKLRMMVVQTEQLPMEMREQALQLAVESLAAKWQQRWDDALKMVEVVVDDPALDGSFRRGVLWSHACQLMAAGQLDLMEALLDKPLMREPEAEVLAGIGRDFLVVARSVNEGPAPVREAAMEVFKRELGDSDLSVIQVYHSMLVGHGDEQGAELLRAKLKDCRMAPDVVGRRRAFRLQLMQEARRAKPLLQLVSALQELGRERISDLAKKAPEDWHRRVDIWSFHDIDWPVRDSILAAIVSTGRRHDRSSVDSWCRHESFWLGVDETFNREAYLKALELVNGVEGNPMAGICLLSLLGQQEVLQKREWEVIDRILKQSMPEHADPEKKAVIGLWQVLRDYRAGKKVDFRELVENCGKAGFLGNFVLNDVLACALINGDRRGIEMVADKMDPDVLTDTNGTLNYLRALELLGREDEHELMMETVGRTLDEWVMDSWVGGDAYDVNHVCQLAIHCGLEQRVPVQWRKDVASQCGDPDDARMIRAYVAQLDKDWKGVLTELGKVDPEEFNKADWHLMMGKARLGLGQKDQARAEFSKVAEVQLMDFNALHEANRLLKLMDQAP